MVLEKIKAIFADYYRVDEETLTPETNLQKDLNADSVDVVELLFAIEDEFDIEIPEEEIEKMHTIGDIVNYIEDKV